MNPILQMILTAAANYAQSPAGLEQIKNLLPNIIGAAQALIDKLKDTKAKVAEEEARKTEMAQHIVELVTAAAVKAKADAAAHPTDDLGFDQAIFRD